MSNQPPEITWETNVKPILRPSEISHYRTRRIAIDASEPLTLNAAYDPATYEELFERLADEPSSLSITPAKPEDEACVNMTNMIREQIRSQLPEYLRPAFDRGDLCYYISGFVPHGLVEGEPAEMTITITPAEPQ